MLEPTQKADYGLMAMKHLAERTEAGPAPPRTSDSYGLPQEALAQILQRLVKSGLLRSRHGTHGGYTLARDPRTISAFEVIRAIDGPLFIKTRLVAWHLWTDRAPHRARAAAQSQQQHRRRPKEHQAFQSGTKG